MRHFSLSMSQIGSPRYVRSVPLATLVHWGARLGALQSRSRLMLHW